MFLEDLVLCIRKGYMPLLSCTNTWLHIWILHQCSHVVFLFHPSFVEHSFLTTITEAMNLHVLPSLESTTIVSYSFDLWMSKDGVDTFAWSLIIWMELWHLSMLPWGYLKCMKLLTMPCHCNFKFYWKNLVSFTMWLLLWKMKRTNLKVWLQHFHLLMIMHLWKKIMFMKVFALGMWYMSKSC